MSEAKFTNGEWVLVSTDFAGEFELTTEERIDDSKVPILTIDTGYIDVIGEEQKANANLIASAPDMYNLLKELGDMDSWDLKLFVENSDAINEVLAKARGESV